VSFRFLRARYEIKELLFEIVDIEREAWTAVSWRVSSFFERWTTEQVVI
jgi:hypothetical protein